MCAVCLQVPHHGTDVVGMWGAAVQESSEHDACVVEDFLQAVADDNELPTGSELSDDSDDSGKPDQGEGRGAEDAGREENAAPKWLMLQGVNPNPNPNPKLHQKAVVYGILP